MDSKIKASVVLIGGMMTSFIIFYLEIYTIVKVGIISESSDIFSTVFGGVVVWVFGMGLLVPFLLSMYYAENIVKLNATVKLPVVKGI